MKFLERYVQFLNELEGIKQNHDELTNTDVRERLREVIDYYFTQGNAIESDFPQRFSMSTSEGDKQVCKAVHSFITDVMSWAETEEVEVGQTRHRLLEDEKAVSSEGNSYWVFLASDEIFDYDD